MMKKESSVRKEKNRIGRRMQKASIALGMGVLLVFPAELQKVYAAPVSISTDDTDAWMRDTGASLTVTRNRAVYTITYSSPMDLGDTISAELPYISFKGEITSPDSGSVTGNGIATIRDYAAVEEGRLISAAVGRSGSVRVLLQKEDIDSDPASTANCTEQEMVVKEENRSAKQKAVRFLDGTIVLQRSGSQELRTFPAEIVELEKGIAGGSQKTADCYDLQETQVDLSTYEECCDPVSFEVIAGSAGAVPHRVRELVPIANGSTVAVVIVDDRGVVTASEVNCSDSGILDYTIPGRNCMVHLLMPRTELDGRKISTQKNRETVNNKKGSPATSERGGAAASNLGFTQKNEAGSRVIVELLDASANGILCESGEKSITGSSIVQITDEIQVRTQGSEALPVVTAAIGESGSVRAMLKSAGCSIQEAALEDAETAATQNAVRYGDGTVILQRSGKEEMKGFPETVTDMEQAIRNGSKSLAECFAGLTGTRIDLNAYKRCSVPVCYEVRPGEAAADSYTVTEQAPITQGTEVLVLIADSRGEGHIRETRAQENGVIRFDIPANNCVVHLMVPAEGKTYQGIGLKEGAKDLKEASTEGYDSSVYASDENVKRISKAAEGDYMQLLWNGSETEVILSQRAGNYTNANSIAAFTEKSGVALDDGTEGRYVSMAISKAGTIRTLIAAQEARPSARRITCGEQEYTLDGVLYPDGGFICQKGGVLEWEGFPDEIRNMEKKIQDQKEQAVDVYKGRTKLDLSMYKPLGAAVVFQVLPGEQAEQGYRQVEQTMLAPGETVYLVITDADGTVSAQTAVVGTGGILSYQIPGKTCIVRLFGRK